MANPPAGDAPRLAILDWMMPEMDGMSICREVRRLNIQPYIYLILLTARGTRKMSWQDSRRARTSI